MKDDLGGVDAERAQEICQGEGRAGVAREGGVWIDYGSWTLADAEELSLKCGSVDNKGIGRYSLDIVSL